MSRPRMLDLFCCAGGAIRAELATIGRALGSFASAIKSGEEWTPTCADEQGAAWAASTALEAHLLALASDAARLDWLDSQRVDVETHVPGRGDPAHVGYKWRLTGHLHQKTARQAIDAARTPPEDPTP